MISIVLCEGILRVLTGDEYYIWLPNLKYVFYPDPAIFPGIKGTSYLEINSMGLRGNSDDVSDAANILVLGGSATECLYLDQSETWPALLEKYLNQGSQKKYNVFNGGRSGITSQHHLAQVKMLLERGDWIDLIIIMEGLNDLQYALSFESGYKQKDLQSVYEEAFWLSPFKEIKPFYRDTYIFKYFSKVKKAIFSPKLTQDPKGDIYIKWRTNRANASAIIDTKPNLDSSLNDYQKNNQAIIDLAKSKNKKIIFIVQPVAWDSIMSSDFSKLCWYGWIGKSQYENTGKYYSFAKLRNCLSEYDSSLKNTCLKNRIGFVELNDKLEKDTTTFYDDCHFNEKGAEKVAQYIFNYLQPNKNKFLEN